MCVPSRWEGFGIVFIEAASCEAAIVTSNIAPMNEYLENGKNAVLVDEYENPKEIADAVKLACEKTDEVKRMCKAARNVGLRFSKEKVDEMECDIYSRIINGTAGNKRNRNVFTWILNGWKYRTM